MNWNLLSDPTSYALSAALTGAAVRQRTLAHNIANLDTPGFIRADVDFSRTLTAALRTAAQAPHRNDYTFSHIAVSHLDYASPARADGNNVDLDREMVALSQTALHHHAAFTALSTRLRALRSAMQSPSR